jgi:hypothetical protein
MMRAETQMGNSGKLLVFFGLTETDILLDFPQLCKFEITVCIAES